MKSAFLSFGVTILLVLVSHSFWACSSNQVDCEPHVGKVCREGNVYWVDSCGTSEEKIAECQCGCNADLSGCMSPCDCTPACAGRQCGPDGCTSTCPPGCDLGKTCNEATGLCQGECTPSCAGKQCGPDGCKGICPPGCDSDQTCNEATGLCEAVCTPSCEGKQCGPDGCKGTCPPGCDLGKTCDEATGLCGACTPNCEGKQCGADCTGKSCGLCAQGSFCDETTSTCIVEGVGTCWDGKTCAVEQPNCIRTCVLEETRCCTVVPNHPLQIDGTIEDRCEVCCTNAQYPHPVLWPDGNSSCCSDGFPNPFVTCGAKENKCCSQQATHPHLCDGTSDESCGQCCQPDHPIAILFPDGTALCCPESSPWPCVLNGIKTCCAESGKCS